MIDNKALNFAKKSIKEKSTPKYVKKQCRDFIKICNGKNDKYVFDEKKYIKIEKILKLLVMPKGLKAGQSLYECRA